MPEGENRSDVLVVGGGVMGMMVALEVARRGKKVRIVDKAMHGVVRTHVGELGFFSGDPVMENMLLQARTAWQAAGQTYGEDFGLAAKGSLELATSKGRVVMAQNEALQQGGEVEVIFGRDILEMRAECDLSDKVLAGKWEPNAPVLSTHTVLDALYRQMVAMGVIVWDDAEVVEIIHDADDGIPKVKGVRIKTGDIAYAEEVIVVAGAMTHIILETLDLKLPLRPMRQHLITFKPKVLPGFTMLSHRMRRGHVALKRLHDDTVMMSYDGLMDPTQATYSRMPDDELVQMLRDYMADLLPFLAEAEMTDVKVVTGAVAPDFRPVVGRWPGVGGLWVVTGLAGRTYAYASVVALTLGQIMVQEMPTTLNIAPFAPNRFEIDKWPRFQRPPSLAWNEQAVFHGKAKFADKVNTTGSGPAEYMNNVQMTDGKGKVQMAGDGKETRVREKGRGKVQMGGVGRRA